MKLPNIKDNSESLIFIVALSIIALIFFYIILGLSGVKAAFGIILLFMLPIYLILKNFDLQQDEKIVFSFFIGAGILSSMVYWAGMVISFRMAIFASFLILILIGIMLGKFKNKKTN